MKGNKINWQDLAAELAASAGIPRKDAEAFVRTFFDVLGKGVLADKSVKVKALGTFKLVEVQERESVNVNTGERITISGHSKIGFLPDNVLKELVNKPFADFQTVILNEGTTLEDIEKINKKYPAEETNE
ncbi:MAG: HU family DNA-binding protein, partial [Bacteroidaceae bacterium]|nr:HU family DNA-binding protein [Bacteroidaceae bacterium]